MITIKQGNSYSTIKGLQPSDEKRLRESLSYIVGGSSSYFSGYGPRRRSLLSKKGEFPTGLLHRVKTFLDSNNLVNSVITAVKYPRPHSTAKLIEGYSWQTEAVEKALIERRGIISAPTGTGKSRAIQMLANQLGLRTLVVVPSLEIKRQLADVLADLPNVIVENIDSKLLSKINNVDVLIIDEAHHAAAKTYHKLNRTAWKGISYRFFFTATPFRNDNEETLLFESIAGRIIFKLSYTTAIKQGYIAPVEAYYFESLKQSTDAYTYPQVYKELVVYNQARNALIATLMNRLKDSSTLILVKEIQHGIELSAITGVPFVCGEDEESRAFINQFNNNQIKQLIGTTGVIGEGVDTKPCEYVIIAGLGKAKSQFMQQVGRAVRVFPGKESAKIIIIKDNSHRFTIRHFNAQKKILIDEYRVNPVKLHL